MLSQPAPQIIFRRHETFVIANLFKIFQVFPMFPGKRFENLRCLEDSQSLSNSHPRSQQVPAGPSRSHYPRKAFITNLVVGQVNRVQVPAMDSSALHGSVHQRESGSSICNLEVSIHFNMFQFISIHSIVYN